MEDRRLTLPTFADVESAAARLAGVAHRTPVLTSRTFDKRVGAHVFFKCENFQRVGAFKFRGAYNAMSRLTDAQKAAGVLAYSSGNHAQAVALSGRLLGVRTTIVMPRDAPALKLAATRGYGAEVVEYDRSETVREELGRRLATERGLTLIPPFDHPHVIAGQGTTGLELLDEVSELDALVVCVGGAGLLSGCALAARAMAPKCRVIGVEPAAGDDAVRSFRSGELVRIENPDTIADGARTNAVGAYTLALMLANVDDMRSVEDKSLIRQMRFFAERMKMWVEPTGCLAAAAVAEGIVEIEAGSRVGVIVSGGNIDAERFCALLNTV